MTRMLRFALLAGVTLGAGAATGCNKPSEGDCKTALLNMRELMHSDSPTADPSLAGDLRRCRGGSTRTSVKCAAAATTLDQLRACDFMKVPNRPAAAPAASPAGSAAGSATGSAPR